MEMIDGPMILKFIDNSDEFEKYAEEKFKMIVNQTEEKKKVAESIAMDGEESQDDRVTAVDFDGYKADLKEMMKAIAIGIGNTPVNMLIGDDSLWLKVYEVEISRINKEKQEQEEERKKIEEEEKNKKKIEEEKRERERERGINNGNGNSKKLELIGPRKMKKKNSFDFLNFCGCSGKQFVENN